MAWDQLAEQCRDLAKGAHIYVEGRIQTRQWAEANGQQRTTTEVIASDVIMLAEEGAPDQPTRSTGNRSVRRNPRVRPAAPPPDLNEVG